MCPTPQGSQSAETVKPQESGPASEKFGVWCYTWQSTWLRNRTWVAELLSQEHPGSRNSRGFEGLLRQDP